MRTIMPMLIQGQGTQVYLRDLTEVLSRSAVGVAEMEEAMTIVGRRIILCTGYTRNVRSH